MTKVLAIKPNASIVFFLPNLHGGGTERSFVQIANFVVQFEEVDFVLADASGPYLSELSPQVRVVELGTKSRLICLFKLTLFLKKSRPKCLVTGLCQVNFGAIVASHLAGLKDINLLCQRVVFSRAWLEWLSPVRYYFHKILFGFAFRRAALIIANSESVKRDLVKELKLNPCRVISVLNPVDYNLLETGITETVDHPWFKQVRALPVICFVGSLSQRKDVSTCIKAFSIALNKIEANLYIIGDGPDRKKYEQLVDSLGITANVEFAGFRVNPFKFMAHCDLFLSTSKFEGCPNAIQQAIASGARVLATDEPGGTAEILGYGKFGTLVEVGDSEGIASQMLKILSQRDTNKNRLSRVEYAKGFDSEVAYSKYYNSITAIIEGQGSN